MRGSLSAGWDTVRVWLDLDPAVLTVPCPRAILQAAVVVAICWVWIHFGRYLLHRFHGLHRGVELFRLKRHGVVSPKLRPGNPRFAPATRAAPATH